MCSSKMKEKEWEIRRDAQFAKEYQSTKASVEDEQEESSNAAAQQEPSKTAAQAEPFKPIPHQGSCASLEYQTLFVPWRFKAPSKGQTAMPPSITSLVNNLPTIEETMSAKQLWNRSLPIAANVGIIEYNRVDGKTFKEKVGEKYGEGWWRRLEDLAAGLNEAAGVIKGKGQELEGKTLDDGPRKGKEYEMKMVELTEGEGYEPEMKNLNETPGKAKESEITTRDHLAEAAVTIGGNSNTKTTNPTTRKTQEAPIKPGDETTEATLSLLSLSETPAGANPTNNPSALATSNTLSALWYLIDRFFSSGHEAASYFLVALEAAIRHDKPVVHPLHIPAPPAFWTDAADWQKPKVGMTLILTLAASEKTMFDAFARFTKSLGAPALKAEAMQKVKSASLRKAVLRAKDDAANKQRTTVLGVNLRDVHHSQLCERYGKDFEERFATFARMFVLGICPDGAKLWLVGGPWGETGTVWESNSKAGAAVGTWEEMDEFVRDFEGFAVPDGHWTSKRFKWFRRCFAVDLKQFDLQIEEEEEKKKRGMVVHGEEEGVKRLLNEIEAWVEIYTIKDVKREDMAKFSWL